MELASTCRHVGLGVMMREGEDGFQVTRSSSSGRAVVVGTKHGEEWGGWEGAWRLLPSSAWEKRAGIISFCPPGPFNVLFQSRSVAHGRGAVARLPPGLVLVPSDL